MGKVRFYTINFVRVVLILAVITAYLNHRRLVLLISTLAFVVTFLPYLVHKKFAIKIPEDLEIIIILFIYGTLFFGVNQGFYERYWWWDVILNLGASIGLGFIGLTILYVLYKDEQLDASPIIISLFTFCFAFALGTLLEFFEFFLDGVLGFNLQLSLFDTMKDLIVDAVGAIMVAVAGYIYLQKGKDNMISKFIINFVEKNPLLFRSKKPETNEDKIKKIIEKGETETQEFKSTSRTNIFTKEFDRKIEHSNLKTISAFLNSNGGLLLIGISDKGDIPGIERDNFQDNDKAILHLTNLIKNYLGKEFFRFIEISIIKIGDKSIIKIECQKSDKPCFLKFNQAEEFYIRNGPSSVKLDGGSLIDYVNRRFVKE